MTTTPGRRERKKAATRQNIADSAFRLFRERGFAAVGIRDVAAEADVAVTTLFSHFASKEALVFDQDQDVELRLTRAVTERSPQEPLITALQRETWALVQHCGAEEAAPLWRLIDETPALQEYEKSMRLRHADALAAVIATDLGLSGTSTACRGIARFVIDAFSLGREASDPEAAVEELFAMIGAGWTVAEANRARP